jgi:hypothetical protein
MDSTEDAFKTIPSSKRDRISFQPQPWLASELESIKKSHKLSVTEAIHYGFEQWNTLREQKPSADSPNSETVPTPWKDIDCRLLVELPKIGHECLCLRPPIRVLHPLMSSEVCKICQKEAEEREQIEKTLTRNNLNPRTNHKIAQLIHGLEVERDTTRQGSQSKDDQIASWRKRTDEGNAQIKSLKQRIQEWQSKEADLNKREIRARDRESAIEKTKQEYSEQREALQNYPALKTRVETLTKEVETLKAENKDLQELPALRKQVETLEADKGTLETDNEFLKTQLEENKENPMVLCPDKGSVPLNECLKDCKKIADCVVYPSYHDFSQKRLKAVEVGVTKP